MYTSTIGCMPLPLWFNNAFFSLNPKQILSNACIADLATHLPPLYLGKTHASFPNAWLSGIYYTNESVMGFYMYSISEIPFENTALRKEK